MLHLVGCLYYLYQWCTVKQLSDNEMYLLIKYIKSVLWRVAKCRSYIEEARSLKVNQSISQSINQSVIKYIFYRNVFACAHLLNDVSLSCFAYYNFVRNTLIFLVNYLWICNLKYEVNLISMWKTYFPRNCKHYIHYKECFWERVAANYVRYRQHGIELLARYLDLCLECVRFEFCPWSRLG